MRRAWSARALPGKHQQLELGPALPAKGHGAWCDKEIFPSLPSGWPLSTGEGVMRRTCTAELHTDGAEMGCLPGHLIHHLPGPDGGDVTQ